MDSNGRENMLGKLMYLCIGLMEHIADKFYLKVSLNWFQVSRNGAELEWVKRELDRRRMEGNWTQSIADTDKWQQKVNQVEQ